MSNIVVIPRNNKRAIEAMKKIQEAKAALRKFIANGGSAKDFKATTREKK